MRKTVVILALSLLNQAAVAADSAIVSGKVSKWIDGDSFHISDIEIRLDDVDAPEQGQQFNKKAKEALRDIVAERVLTCRQTDWDSKFKRVVARCAIEDTDVGERLVRDGFAWAKDGGTYVAAMQEARQARKGLWQEKSPMSPWEFRKHEEFPWHIALGSALASSLLTLAVAVVWRRFRSA